VTNFLASVETNVGILAVCLTTLRPSFAWVLDTANNLSFRTTQTRRQSTNEQLFGQTSIRPSSINSEDQPIGKEKAFRGPTSRVEQNIRDLENDSEECVIGKGSDRRA
jgi:hypothetical protein